MEKSQKKKKVKGRKKATQHTPVITKATTKDKIKALHNAVGMWADREES